ILLDTLLCMRAGTLHLVFAFYDRFAVRYEDTDMQEQRASIASPTVRSFITDIGHRVRHALPTGGYLPDHIWQQRHTGTLIFLWIHAVALATIGTVTGHGFAHSLSEASLV